MPTAFASPKLEERRRASSSYGESKTAMNYVYLLSCKDKRTYIGCTSDLKDRIKRHESGNVPATKDRLPIKLVSYFAFSNKYKAFEFEKYLKSGSGRAFLNKHLI